MWHCMTCHESPSIGIAWPGSVLHFIFSPPMSLEQPRWRPTEMDEVELGLVVVYGWWLASWDSRWRAVATQHFNLVTRIISPEALGVNVYSDSWVELYQALSFISNHDGELKWSIVEAFRQRRPRRPPPHPPGGLRSWRDARRALHADLVEMFILERHFTMMLEEHWPLSCPPACAGQEAIRYLVASLRDGIEIVAFEPVRPGLAEMATDRSSADRATQVPEA